MITRQVVEERARELFNSSPATPDDVDVGIYEFELGFVVWPVEPEPTDWSRPPSTIGGSVLVFDRNGTPSVWPRLAAPQVADLYRDRRN